MSETADRADLVDEASGIPSTSETGSPAALYSVIANLRHPSSMLRPLKLTYHLQSEKARDEDLKKHGNFDPERETLTPELWNSWIFKFALRVGPPLPAVSGA